MKKILLLLFFLSYLSNYQAQDVHWSQINENELYHNPANTGDFHGDFRASVSTKDQWRNVTKPYQTQAVTFDIINKYDRKLGYGGLFLHDVTGDGIFRTIEMKLTPASPATARAIRVLPVPGLPQRRIPLCIDTQTYRLFLFARGAHPWCIQVASK